MSDTWLIVLIATVIFAIMFLVYRSRKAAAAALAVVPAAHANSLVGATQSVANGLGVGSLVGTAVGVEHTAQGAFNTVNNAVTNTLAHIPIAGSILKQPTKIAGQIVNGTLGFLGF